MSRSTLNWDRVPAGRELRPIASLEILRELWWTGSGSLKPVIQASSG